MNTALSKIRPKRNEKTRDSSSRNHEAVYIHGDDFVVLNNPD